MGLASLMRLDQAGLDIPGPGPASQGLEAVLVDGDDDHFRARRLHPTHPQLEVVELKLHDFGKVGPKHYQQDHYQGHAGDQLEGDGAK